jgi:putative CocE/NonD family hydrolase
MPVKVAYDVLVPMSDGVRLSGNLYLPEAAGTYPAILTYIPYLKDGYGGLGMLDAYHRHFAARGYAVLQVDFRGTGGSEGVNPRFLEERERTDGYEVVEWIAAQRWCTGDVGVWGISYGGLTALSIAMMNPPHLRAIAPVHAPDDMQDSLIIHRGSRLMYWAEPHWGPAMAAMNLMPPLRGFDDGGAWLRMWRERLEANTPWQLVWHGEPPYEGYWENARVDPRQIQVPTFVVCGWHDAYPDDAVRIFTGVQGPKRLLLGPWKHIMPDRAPVEPIGVTAEIDRWWDRWLKGIDNLVDREPPVTIFVQGEGGWRNEAGWPIERTREQHLYPISGGALSRDQSAGAGGWDEYTYDARAGTAALAYDAVTHGVPYPADQSEDDVLSLCYTTAPLSEALEITGQPSVEVSFSTDAPLEEVNLVAKLCDIQPDGRSFLITHDNVNAATAERTAAVDRRPVHRIALPLRATSYRLGVGHRLRLAISGANFPYIWPTPRRYALLLRTGGGTLVTLPVLCEQDPPLPAPQLALAGNFKPIAELDGGTSYAVRKGLTARTVEVQGERRTRNRVDEHSVFSRAQQFAMSVDADHPDRASTSETATIRLERPVGSIEVRVDNVVTLSDLYLRADVRLDGKVFFERTWEKSLPGQRQR